jgi:hypothetical protein
LAYRSSGPHRIRATWTARLVEKGADGLTARVEGASKTVGTVAGNLHRSFNEAKRAGVAEMKRSRSNEKNVERTTA